MSGPACCHGGWTYGDSILSREGMTDMPEPAKALKESVKRMKAMQEAAKEAAKRAKEKKEAGGK